MYVAVLSALLLVCVSVIAVDRRPAYRQVRGLRRIVMVVLFVVTTTALVNYYGYFYGILLSIVAGLVSIMAHRAQWFQRHIQTLYRRYEKRVGVATQHWSWAAWFATPDVDESAMITSHAELLDIATRSHVLSARELQQFEAILSADHRRVKDIMVPVDRIVSVSVDESLGPIVLDDLHRSGYRQFPVIKADIDHVVGILHIKDLLSLGKKETETAETAMEKRVFYINAEQTLDHALAAFIKTRHHLFIVVNGYRETAGILTLEDTIEALLGREIVDEFDVHDDLRLVAARSAKDNNNPPYATTV